MYILNKVCCYMTTSVAAIYYFYDSVIISRKLLKRPMSQGHCDLQAICHWFDKIWIIPLLEESHGSTAHLKVLFYSTELVTVIFIWNLLCEMHKSTCSHSLLFWWICQFVISQQSLQLFTKYSKPFRNT